MQDKKPVLWNDLSKIMMKLPNMGVVNAKKLSIFLIQNKALLRQLIDAMEAAYKDVRLCSQCRNFTSKELCDMCSSSGRDKNVLCVVRSHIEMYAIEAAMIHNGLYYILGEDFSPSSPGNRITQIKDIIEQHDCAEVMLAFSASIDGSILLHYMKLMLKDLRVQLTHLGIGIPINADLEAVGPDTLQMAIRNRKAVRE